MHVCDVIVANDMCVGCGTCAAMCPAECLHMEFTSAGELNPVMGEGCTECGLCLRVCPFYDSPLNEDTLAEKRFGGQPGVQRHTEVGYHLATYVGRVATDSGFHPLSGHETMTKTACP